LTCKLSKLASHVLFLLEHAVHCCCVNENLFEGLSILVRRLVLANRSCAVVVLHVRCSWRSSELAGFRSITEISCIVSAVDPFVLCRTAPRYQEVVNSWVIFPYLTFCCFASAALYMAVLAVQTSLPSPGLQQLVGGAQSPGSSDAACSPLASCNGHSRSDSSYSAAAGVLLYSGGQDRVCQSVQG